MKEELQKLLTELEQSRFYGTVEIGYQAGNPGHAKVSKAVKFTNNSTNRDLRGDNDDSTLRNR